MYQKENLKYKEQLFAFHHAHFAAVSWGIISPPQLHTGAFRPLQLD